VLLRHRVVPGLHEPPQAPVVVSQIPVQVVLIVQFPVVSHVCWTVVLPLMHRVVPGTHDPEHMPVAVEHT
jgi:hypothetical protein